VTALTRHSVITADDIRAYSRRGNYHSDPDTAKEVGLPGLVAQGVHVAGPAYAALLDEWGDAFLAHGEIDLRFVGMVLADHAVSARVIIDGEEADVEVRNATTGRTAVVGTARSSASPVRGETA
jgi:acyl dehydratase